jgi:hypothetical protein
MSGALVAWLARLLGAGGSNLCDADNSLAERSHQPAGIIFRLRPHY